jgi:actin-related protein
MFEEYLAVHLYDILHNSMSESQTPVVLDNGSGVIKIGYASTDAPKSTFATIVGKPRMPGVIIGTEHKDSFIGEEAQLKRGVLNMTYPMEHGKVLNWDDMEKIWTHAFQNELRVSVEEHPVFLIEASANPMSNKEKTTQVMFEKFSVNGFYIGNQATLSLYASSKMSGVIVYSGDGVTHVDPIFEGYSFPHAVSRVDFGGRDVNSLLAQLLNFAGAGLRTSGEMMIVKDIREKHCFVSENYEQSLSKSQKNRPRYKLPDDNILKLGHELFKAPEIIFNPEIYNQEFPSVQRLVKESIEKTGIEFKRYMFENIMVSGGNTMYPYYAERLQSEIVGLVDPADGHLVKVKGKNERRYLPWIGGSNLCALSSFHSSWVTKSEYEEQGSRAIHKII